MHGSLCPIGTFSFWAFIPYSFLIIPSHPVKSIILFSTFLLPTNEREIKQPPSPPLRAPYDEDAASLWYSNNRHFCYLYAVTYLKEVTYLDGVTYDCSVKYVNGMMCNNCSVMNL